ncbi:MAG: tetratricopeptide repeat protein [Proteobacteria bacterium]|nr:tetratricopeptide repeat protein [Pseudomonadota bacterium]
MTFSTFKKAVLAVALFTALGGCASKADKNASALTQSLRQLAVVAEQGGDYQTAAQHYHNLQRRKPEDLGALLGLARNLRYSGSPNVAITTLEEMKADFGADGAFLLELGKAHLAAGKAKKSLEHLNAALKKDGGNWEIHVAKGIAYDLLQSYGEARQAYRKALELSEGNPHILNNLAISAASAGDLDLAISTLEKASVAARKSPQMRQNLALFYGIRGDFDKAEALARMDLDEKSVRNNLAIFSGFHKERH